MVTGKTLVMDEMEERVEDILTMYAAGVASRMEEDYQRGLGWSQYAEKAAFQLGTEAHQSNEDAVFGIAKLDKAYIRGRTQPPIACKVYNLHGEEIDGKELLASVGA